MTTGKAIFVVAELLWVWAIIDCNMTEGLGGRWFWVLFIGNLPAAFIYWFVYKNPYLAQAGSSTFLKRWAYRQKILYAEEDVRQIGNAIQYVELAGLLREIGDISGAQAQYKKAIEKEPSNTSALWGDVTLAEDRGKLSDARHSLETLLTIDPEWESGTAALFHIRLLIHGGESAAAQVALKSYLKDWYEPEARLYEATFLSQHGENARAHERLVLLIEDIKNSAAIPYRRNRPWMKAAQKLQADLKKKGI